LLYVTDNSLNRVVVFSPVTRSVVATIPVGIHPVGLALTSDGETLYVANSGEYSVSVVDVDLRTQLYKIGTSSQDPGSGFNPYDIAVVSDTVALVSSDPPGLASGGPIHQLDLDSRVISQRDDLGGGARSVLRTSFDKTVSAIVLEPGASPTGITRYEPANNSIHIAADRMERAMGLSADGSRIIAGLSACNTLIPDLRVLDESLTTLGFIQLQGCQVAGVAFSPVAVGLAYATDEWYGSSLGVVDTSGLRENLQLALDIPPDYYVASQALIPSSDGTRLYQLLIRSNNAAPSKLIGLTVQPGELVPPVSAMDPLVDMQPRAWWLVKWSGVDTGSGIDHYELQYKAGVQGPWHYWRSNAMTQALFTEGVPGETYYFRVRAVDKLGNSEGFRSGFDAMTVSGSGMEGLSQSFLPVVNR
jgi:YVTN family beta-propeller protein